MRISRIISLLVSCTVVVAEIFSCSINAFAESTGVNVSERTPQEIKQYVDEHEFEIYSSDTYKTAPAASYPYELGELSEQSYRNALNALNCMRFIAGLPEVTLDAQYNTYAQAAALVNCATGQLTHSPQKPSDMPDDIYNLGKTGAASSNLSYYMVDGKPYANCAYNVFFFTNDSDNYNINRVGHRRWCLNPKMSGTGFGKVDCYFAMYAFDGGRTDATETGVCWPAQNMPVEYFAFSDTYYSWLPAWSISMGKDVDDTAVEVTLTRKSDNKKWKFNKSAADGDFYVDNSYRGQVGCIIFRPTDISYSAGESFDVKITGMEETVEYSVNFFSLYDVLTEYRLGDVNINGRIDASDASLVLKEYSAMSTSGTSILSEEQKKCADVNIDNAIDASDASVILAYYVYVSTGGSLALEQWKY